jgi:hypothetical protein
MVKMFSSNEGNRFELTFAKFSTLQNYPVTSKVAELAGCREPRVWRRTLRADGTSASIPFRRARLITTTRISTS